uniref:THAP-type domain-containing protein n=1 Tax=Panagrolaimus davidi TaxID=227884 RepID=A0A914Q5I6_9BILA
MRRRCWLCNLEFEYKNAKYNGVRIPRGRKKMLQMAQHLNMPLNNMSDLKEHDAICHRHYEEFSFSDKGSTNIKKHLIVPENVLPNHIKNIRNNVCRDIPDTTVIPSSTSHSKLPDNEAAKSHPSSTTV